MRKLQFERTTHCAKLALTARTRRMTGSIENMDDADRVELQFPGIASAEAGRLVEDLADLIRKEDQSIGVTTRRTSPDAMDGGTILILALGTPVAVALARGIADWIRKRGDPELVIKCGKDQIIVQSGLSPDQKFELVKAALHSKN